MAINNLGLGFVFRAKDLASGTIMNLQRNMGRLGKRSTSTATMMKTGFAAAAGGIATLAAGGIALNSAIDAASFAGKFQQGVARVANISGATTEELGKLRDAAIEAGMRTQFSPQESIDGLATLAAKGFNATQSMNLLNQSLNLAAGGQIGIADASEAAASAVRVFSLQGNEVNSVADKLLKITNLTSLQAGDLSLALGTVSRGAGLTKQSLDDMLISMGLVRNTGVDTSVAASATSSALIFAAKNAKKFNEIGVSVTDAEGKFRNFFDIVMETGFALEEGTKNEAEFAGVAQKLFGRFGITAFQNVFSQLRERAGGAGASLDDMRAAVGELQKEMRGAEGTAQKFADSLLDNFEGQTKILEGVLETMKTVIGEPLARIFRPFVEAFSNTVGFIAKIFNSLPEQMKNGIAAFIVFGSVIAIAIGLIATLSGIIAILLPFMAIALKAFLFITAAMAPFVAAVLGAAAVIGIFVLAVRKNLGGMGDWFNSIVEKMSLAFNGLKQLFTTGELTGQVREDLRKTENEGVLSFVKTIFMLGFRLKKFFTGVSIGFQTFMATIGPTLMVFKSLVINLLQQFGFLQKGADSLASESSTKFVQWGIAFGIAAGKIIKFILGLVNFFVFMGSVFVRWVQMVVSVWTGLWEVLKFIGSGIASIFTTIAADIQKKIASIINAIATIVSAVPKSLLPDGVAEFVTEAKVSSEAVLRTLSNEQNNPGVAASRAEDNRLRDLVRQQQGEAADRKPTIIEMKLNGEAIGRATMNENRRSRALGFEPVETEIG